MQEQAAATNDERRRQGYATVRLIGWAAPPHYSRQSHKLYWAKELAFSDESEHTLNYNVRVLGRRGGGQGGFRLSLTSPGHRRQNTRQSRSVTLRRCPRQQLFRY
jgi:uncharacterized membrane-anchored protein